jgi:hypothetical protein
VSIKASEEERKRMREVMQKQKNRNAKQFLEEMNVNKEKFINYKKKVFKEDRPSRIVNGLTVNSGTSST